MIHIWGVRQQTNGVWKVHNCEHPTLPESDFIALFADKVRAQAYVSLLNGQ